MAAMTWICAQCFLSFDKSKLLERHALQTTHKAYRCTKCSKAFAKRTASIRHNATHSDTKNHACRVCKKTFVRKDHCNEHEEVCTHRLATATKERFSATLIEHPGALSTHPKSQSYQPESDFSSSSEASPSRYFELDHRLERVQSVLDGLQTSVSKDDEPNASLTQPYQDALEELSSLQFFRPVSPVFEDQLYDATSRTITVPAAPASKSYSSSQHSLVAERLQIANQARQDHPQSGAVRKRSPFKLGSPLAGAPVIVIDDD